MLGRMIRAQELWIITDIDYVYLRFKIVDQKAILNMTMAEAEKILNRDSLAKAIWPQKSKQHYTSWHTMVKK